MTVREVLDGCETTATPADLLLLLDAERRRQGLRKYELARLCGVSASKFSTLTSARNSERLKVKNLLMIAVALGLVDSQEVSASGRGPARKKKVSRRASPTRSKRRAGRVAPPAPRGDEEESGDPPEGASPSVDDPRADGSPADDYTTVGLREAAVILGMPLSGLVELAEKKFLPGAVLEGGRWRITPLAIAKIIEAKETGDRAVADMAEVRRRLDAVEQASEELKGQVKLIESVRELLLQQRHNGGAKQIETRVLDLLPEMWPQHFEPGKPVILGDLLRVFPDASEHSIEFLASALMYPAPPMAKLMRHVEEWKVILQTAAKGQERRESGGAEREG